MELANFLFDNGPEIFWIILICSISFFLALDYIQTWHPMKSIVSYGKTDELFHGLTVLVVPKRYFSHFYFVSTIWSFILLYDVINVLYLKSDESSWLVKYFCSTKPYFENDRTSVLLCLVLIFIQGSRRLYECLFVSVFSAKSTMNVLHYGLGLSFYILEPITIFCKIGPITNLKVSNLTVGHGIGILLFLLASYHQHQAFLNLANLRKSPGDSGYKIPHGGLFKYISCPHYLAEIVIYLSLTIVMSFSHFSWLCVFLFVIVIHLQMAKMTHDWYKTKFKTYPKNRKSIVPFLF